MHRGFICQKVERPARCILLGVLLYAHAAGQRLPFLPGFALHPHFDQKRLWWSGPLSVFTR